MINYSPKGRCQVLRPILKIFLGPSVIFGMGEAKHSKFGVKIDTDEYWRVLDKTTPK